MNVIFVEAELMAIHIGLIVKDMQSRGRVTQSGAELLQSGRELTTKVEEQPWPQLVCCALIYCCTCGCIFQEDGIVVRNAGEK